MLWTRLVGCRERERSRNRGKGILKGVDHVRQLVGKQAIVMLCLSLMVVIDIVCWSSTAKAHPFPKPLSAQARHEGPL